MRQNDFIDSKLEQSNFVCDRVELQVENLPGLPDGIFSNQNPNLGKFWRDLQ
jgi:hypothetical protein